MGKHFDEAINIIYYNLYRIHYVNQILTISIIPINNDNSISLSSLTFPVPFIVYYIIVFGISHNNLTTMKIL